MIEKIVQQFDERKLSIIGTITHRNELWPHPMDNSGYLRHLGELTTG